MGRLSQVESLVGITKDDRHLVSKDTSTWDLDAESPIYGCQRAAGLDDVFEDARRQNRPLRCHLIRLRASILGLSYNSHP